MYYWYMHYRIIMENIWEIYNAYTNNREIKSCNGTIIKIYYTR